jgi:hypothetical protein
MIDPENLAAIETHCIVCGTVVPSERTKHKSTTCTEEHSSIRKARLKKGDPSCKCVVCTRDVPADRAAHRAITCSPEHRILRKRSIRARVDVRRCRHCTRPATPIERAAFRRFRKLELMRPDLLYPGPWKQWQQLERGDLTAFSVYLANTLENDDAGELDAQLGLIDKRFKDRPGGVKSGRPRAMWEGGDPECSHQLPVRRKGGKPIPAVQSNRCRKCSALRVGMDPREWEEETSNVASEGVVLADGGA